MAMRDMAVNMKNRPYFQTALIVFIKLILLRNSRMDPIRGASRRPHPVAHLLDNETWLFNKSSMPYFHVSQKPD
jgi:hypothetical protein